jgi:hypothetical protein
MRREHQGAHGLLRDGQEGIDELWFLAAGEAVRKSPWQ